MPASASFAIDPCDYRDVRSLVAALDLPEPVAMTLVRRGHRTPAGARAFLAASEAHGPFEFESMEEATAAILAAIEAGRRIFVHGDYDADGVCATAILVGALRDLGARCDWYIPARSDGYGFTSDSVERLAASGAELVVCVDCGITSSAEVGAARAAGLEVVVADHHAPGETLPPCPILHPALGGYPFPHLCAAAVAHKLSEALRERAGADPAAAASDLELVALATVADMVPLVGENRRLVRAGLEAARRGARPGMRALIAVSRTDPTTLDEGALAFRLAPRINAAGRLHRADAGVELLLSDDPERAAEIASELDRANAERRAVESRLVAEAEAAIRELAPEQRRMPGLVVAGEGWHPGVIGIVASRLVEAHNRPAVVIGLAGERGRGSGRSIPGFDLVAALEECGEDLERWGGHAGAAGLELRGDRLDSFREAFLERCAAEIAPEDLVRAERVDAVVGVGRDGIGLELAEQLERLAPFGIGNPSPRLLLPAARVRGVEPMGESGAHARFQVESGSGRVLGVAFGVNGSLAGHEQQSIDLSGRLEVNRWNGSVEPRLVLSELYPIPSVPEANASRACPGCDGAAPPPEWWARAEAELHESLDDWPPGPLRAHLAASPGRREAIDRHGGATVAAIAELLCGGERVLALCADGARRRALVESAVDPRRFGAGPAAVCCGRCGEAAVDAAVEGGHQLTLADWGVLARRPQAPAGFEHVVLVDPPPFEHLSELAAVGPGPADAGADARAYLHLCWGEPELELAGRLHATEWDLAAACRRAFAALREAGGEADGEDARRALAGAGPHPLSPEAAGRCLRVLAELGLVGWEGNGGTSTLRVLSSKETALERSDAFRAFGARYEDGRRCLTSRRPSR